jgi:transcriptional regulator EpsA
MQNTAMSLNLASDQKQAYLALCARLIEVADEHDLRAICQAELRTFLPHQALICGFGHINPHTVSGHRVLSVDFPMEYLETIKQDDGSLFSPLMERWIGSDVPVLFDPENARDVPDDWLALVRAQGLGNIVAHGVRDLESNASSYFNFCGVPGPLTPQHAQLIQLATPHLHTALARVLARKEKAGANLALTPREKDILSWLYLGKTNWEIGQILGIAEKTVKNNLYAIYQKINVANRTQALVRITELRLF